MVADPDGPPGAGRLPPIPIEDVGHGEIEVCADDVKVRTLVIQDELAPVRAQIVQPVDGPPVLLGRVARRGVWLDRPFRFGTSRHNGRKAHTPVGEQLGQHQPVGHLRVDQEDPVPQFQPGDGHRDSFGGQKRPITRMDTADDEILDQKLPWQNIGAALPDRDLAVQIPRRRVLQPSANGRPQVDGERRHDRHSERDRYHRRAPAEVATHRTVRPAAQTCAERNRRRRLDRVALGGRLDSCILRRRHLDHVVPRRRRVGRSLSHVSRPSRRPARPRPRPNCPPQRALR